MEALPNGEYMDLPRKGKEKNLVGGLVVSGDVNMWDQFRRWMEV